MNPIIYFIIADLLTDDDSKLFTGEVSEKKHDIILPVLIFIWAVAIVVSAIVVL